MIRQATALAKRAESKILILRRHKVILDVDLAALYGVPVKRLNQQVNRNADRFPSDFLFRLSPAEYKNLRLQFATSRSSHGGRRSLPYAFTEHGAIMAATVLNSERAIEMSIFVVRAFVEPAAFQGTRSVAEPADDYFHVYANGPAALDARRQRINHAHLRQSRPCHEQSHERGSAELYL